MIKMNKIFVLTASLFTSTFLFAQEHRGIDKALMDQSVRPQDDFYNYVNGNWMKTVQIPSDKARWGSFDELDENTNNAVLDILKSSLNTKFVKGSDGQKIADLYNSFIDFTERDRVGIQPIKQQLSDIDAVKNLKDLSAYFSKYGKEGANPFYGGFVMAHLKNSKINAVYLGGGELGLGRSYYQKEDDANKKTLKDYAEFINKLYAKVDPRSKDLKGPKVVAFEKLIAANLLTVEESRDVQKQYNPIALKDLKDIVKNVDVAGFMTEMGFKADTLIVGELKYFKNLDHILNQKNIPLIKDYLKFNLINGASGYLTKELDEISFDFYGRRLKGQQEQRSLDKRGLAFVNNNIGELLGKIYVEKYFPKEAKLACEELVKYLIKSFEIHIENLQWMSPVTKEKALDKLSKFTVKIGYPDNWKDYSKIEIGNSLYINVKNIGQWAFEDNLSKQGKPVDKTEWGMTPQTINAYYNPLNNEIVFPAAILQPPFYDYRADAAVNFGGIGAVIGHELSHGFDDSGSQFDGEGNLNNWWTEEDRAKFESSADALVAQFEKYEPIPGIFVNGRFTLGENIGDLGGSSVAFDALKLYLKDKGNPGLIDGFTPEQRFFLSWATIWRSKTTDAFVVNQVKTDPHSPAQYRAFAPIINLDAFHEAFQTKEGDKLYVPKDKRIVIW